MENIRPDFEYLEFLRQGQFMIQRGRASQRYVFHPRAIEPGTGAQDLEWVKASGRGVVYSTTVVRKRPPTPNYNVALIDLEEGPRLMSRVEGVAPEDVTIGMAVTARIVTEGDDVFVVFDAEERGS